MRQLVLDAVTYPKFRRVAKALIKGYFCAHTLDYVHAAKNFLSTSFMIVDEPDELLIHPIELLNEINIDGAAMGDCDDVATLGAALLAAIGIPVRFKAICQAPEGHYTHVFLEYQLQDGRWHPLDTTLSARPMYDPNDCLIVTI